jgi:hypothetical protein
MKGKPTANTTKNPPEKVGSVDILSWANIKEIQYEIYALKAQIHFHEAILHCAAQNDYRTKSLLPFRTIIRHNHVEVIQSLMI